MGELEAYTKLKLVFELVERQHAYNIEHNSESVLGSGFIDWCVHSLLIFRSTAWRDLRSFGIV